jgi:hypothetical protein
VTTQLTRERTPGAPAVASAAVSALAWAEARLLLRSPMLWIITATAVALGVVWGWTVMPVWQDVLVNAGMASMVLAAGLMVLGHLAASRDHRAGLADAAVALPTSPGRRTVALLSLLPVGAFAGAIALAAQVLATVPTWPVGPLDCWNLVGAVVLPMIGVATGVMVGRWLPAAAAGPLAVVAAAGMLIVVQLLATNGNGSWFMPILLRTLLDSPRGSAAHLIYVLALLLFVVGVLLLRHWRALPALFAVGALLVVAVVAAPQLKYDPNAAILADGNPRPELPRVCETHSAVTYCALVGFQPWIAYWQEAVEPIALAVPPQARGQLPAIRQRGELADGAEPDATQPDGMQPGPAVVDVFTSWSRHGRWGAQGRARLAEQYVVELLRPVDPTALQRRPGVEDHSGSDDAASVNDECSGVGQTRTIVGLWLIAQALPDGAARLAGHKIGLEPARYGQQEIDAAAKLLAQPGKQVTALLEQLWQTVTSAAVGGNALASLGVTGLHGPDKGVESCH